ncbi:SLOG family protein [Nocardia goodfellowii]
MSRVVLVTGARIFTDWRSLHEALDRQLDIAIFDGMKLIVRHGDCPRGADRIARNWCASFAGIYVEEQRRPADWNQHGKAAGFIRNTGMVHEHPKPDVCLAFLSGPSRGTRHCIGEAEKAGIPVIKHQPRISLVKRG